MMSHNERGADADWSTIGVRMASSSEEAIELDGDRVALRGDDGSVQLRVLLVEVIVAVPPWTLLPCMVQRVDESGRPRRPAGDARGATRRVWRIRELVRVDCGFGRRGFVRGGNIKVVPGEKKGF